MNFRDVFIGSAIVGLFSYIISAVLMPYILQGDSNLNTLVKNPIPTFPIIPVTIGLVTFLVFFIHYSSVEIQPSTWELWDLWDKSAEPEHGSETTSTGLD
ncbi:MAG: hypothetical protein QG646_1816 [Euryarchaeota archaeon]|nr:hypothetical protein [Euryarchaeota archaeon]